MFTHAKSIRSFIGAKNFEVSRSFYHQLDFTEVNLGPKMSYFKVNEQLGFYLQAAYVKDWINNSMLFLEIDNLEELRASLIAKELEGQYEKVKLTGIREESWGREFFLHDPSGVLWHFGEFL